jgi:hypothetical protein
MSKSLPSISGRINMINRRKNRIPGVGRQNIIFKTFDKIDMINRI